MPDGTLSNESRVDLASDRCALREALTMRIGQHSVVVWDQERWVASVNPRPTA